MKFVSPTRGQLTFEQVYEAVVAYVKECPQDKYKLIIGTDSQQHSPKVCFVTAVIIHRVGKGARFFFRRHTQRYIESLRQRIYY